MDRLQQLLDAISADTPVGIIEYWGLYTPKEIQLDLQRLMELRLSRPVQSDLKDFTKAAMQGLCANSVFNSPVGADQTPEGVVAQIAVSIACATLSEIQKQQP